LTSALEKLQRAVVSCTRCPRLVAHRRTVAEVKRRMYIDWQYWGRPVPSFGDPDARLLIIGLAPAAHGANRTGRMFTGDRSGDLLYRTLYKFGFATSPVSIHRDDGLALRDAYITAALRCAPPGNKPLRDEMSNCRPYLLQELSLLSKVQVVVALGKIAFDAYLRTYPERGLRLASPRPPFAHAATFRPVDGVHLIASYHPSQQNTQTGRLTPAMFEDVFSLAKDTLAGPPD
jgi:uracil-DNA glycosylase family 4